MKEPNQQPPEIKNPLFITIEGIDGAGKTTLVENIKRMKYDTDRKFIFFREPGTTKLGHQVRELLFNKEIKKSYIASFYLFQAARAQLVEEEIVPALKRGDVIILDRYMDSTYAYQGYGQCLLDVVRANQKVTDGIYFPVPHFTFMLDIPLEKGLERIRKRAEETGEALNQYDTAGMEFKQRVYEGYQAKAIQDGDRIIKINVENKTEEEVHFEVNIYIKEILSILKTTGKVPTMSELMKSLFKQLREVELVME